MADNTTLIEDIQVCEGQEVPYVDAEIESDYMIQPISFTLARYAGDTTKIKLMVTLIDKLQNYIKQRLHNSQVELPLFTDDENNTKIRFKVEMKSICSDPKRYSEIKKLILELGRMPIEMPVKDLSNNTDYTKYTTFCSILWPKEKQYRLYFYVDMEKDVAQRLINLKDFGYQKYLKQVIMTSRSRYTQRLYMLITAWKVQGFVEYSVVFLRQLMGLEAKYTRSSAFIKKVIQTAEQELFEQFQRGVSECYFKYSLRYGPGRSDGKEPQTIYFEIILSEKELENIGNTNVSYIRILCERKMQQMGISKSNINKFMKVVKDEQIPDFDAMLVKLQAKLQREVETISNSARYATEACKNYVAALKPKKKQVKELPASTVDPAPMVNKEFEPFFGYLKECLSPVEYETWIEPIKMGPIEFVAGKKQLSLIVPSQFFVEHIESCFLDELREAATRLAGDDFLLKYKIAPLS